jgi:ribose 5-phosphate isomerase B
VADGRPDATDLVRGDTRADSGAADQDAPLDLAIAHGETDTFGKVGIVVERVGTVAAEVHEVMLATRLAVRDGEVERGILICGSGVGASVAANKIRGVRTAVCHDTYSAHQGVEHDDMNVLTLGSRVIGPELAFECAVAFLRAAFSGEERHRRRLNKVLAIEASEVG